MSCFSWRNNWYLGGSDVSLNDHTVSYCILLYHTVSYCMQRSSCCWMWWSRFWVCTLSTMMFGEIYQEDFLFLAILKKKRMAQKTLLKYDPSNGFSCYSGTLRCFLLLLLVAQRFCSFFVIARWRRLTSSADSVWLCYRVCGSGRKQCYSATMLQCFATCAEAFLSTCKACHSLEIFRQSQVSAANVLWCQFCTMIITPLFSQIWERLSTSFSSSSKPSSFLLLQHRFVVKLLLNWQKFCILIFNGAGHLLRWINSNIFT